MPRAKAGTKGHTLIASMDQGEVALASSAVPSLRLALSESGEEVLRDLYE